MQGDCGRLVREWHESGSVAVAGKRERGLWGVYTRNGDAICVTTNDSIGIFLREVIRGELWANENVVGLQKL